MNLFERFLTLWVFLCIVVGIALGQFAPTVFQALGRIEIAQVNVPVGLLIWVMIIPMLVKIDFSALHEVRNHMRGVCPAGRFVVGALGDHRALGDSGRLCGAVYRCAVGIGTAVAAIFVSKGHCGFRCSDAGDRALVDGSLVVDACVAVCLSGRCNAQAAARDCAVGRANRVASRFKFSTSVLVKSKIWRKAQRGLPIGLNWRL